MGTKRVETVSPLFTLFKAVLSPGAFASCAVLAQRRGSLVRFGRPVRQVLRSRPATKLKVRES